MSSSNVRGTGLGGAASFEDASGAIEYEPRTRHVYSCPLGHETTVVFHAKAEPPAHWDCSVCGAQATHPDAAPDATPTGRTLKTHWEQLSGRRSEAELEALLAEALHNYRTTGKTF